MEGLKLRAQTVRVYSTDKQSNSELFLKFLALALMRWRQNRNNHAVLPCFFFWELSAKKKKHSWQSWRLYNPCSNYWLDRVMWACSNCPVSASRCAPGDSLREAHAFLGLSFRAAADLSSLTDHQVCRNIPELLVSLKWSWKNKCGCFVLVDDGFPATSSKLAASAVVEATSHSPKQSCTMRQTFCEDVFLGRREKCSL